jgi:thiol-disulfide isomerase/thioredoxin
MIDSISRDAGRPARDATTGLLVLLTSIASLALAPGSATAQEGIPLGATPDPVVLETLDGERVDLGRIIGTRPALVEFWASWCHICLALHPRVMAAHEKYGDEVEFLLVAVAVGQDRDRARQYLARHGTPGRVLWDGRGEAVRAFEAPGTGFIVVLDGRGRVAYTGTGADQDLDAALAAVVGPR